MENASFTQIHVAGGSRQAASEHADETVAIIQQPASEGRTIILETHEMAFARKVSTKAIFLREGKFETERTPTEVFEECRSKRSKTFLPPISQ